MSLTLTGKEIIDLAKFAGFEVDETRQLDDELETEYTIYKCPDDGIYDEGNKNPEYYKHVVVLSEYPEEGYHPLGDEIPKKESE